MSRHAPPRLNEARIYTMRQLNQDTGAVVREISEEGQPAFVTRMGRFVAKISPIPPGAFEPVAIGHILREQAPSVASDLQLEPELASSDDVIKQARTRRDRRPGTLVSPENSGDASIYTMRQLSHDTAGVIREINSHDTPAILTLRSRPVAVLSPLASARLEEVALSAVLEATNGWDDILAEHPVSSQELASDLGVRWRQE